MQPTEARTRLLLRKYTKGRLQAKPTPHSERGAPTPRPAPPATSPTQGEGAIGAARHYALTAIVVGAALLAASQAGAWTPDRAAVLDRRAHVNDMRHDKCLRLHGTSYLPRGLSQYWLDRKWETWGARKERTRARLTRCLPTSPAAIIRYVFPDATEAAALSVAYCESRLYTYARNPSGASGLFQLMPFWWEGKFDPFDPWANSRAAYSISSGGTNWGAWVCQP